ncbi:MAG: segregation/condensation protein A [Planctomycetia bacterium]|nr:segregation/condensation protein A [Planctomycetia bacterium]
MSFAIQLDLFRGPLDLLLFLIRKRELNILDIRVSEIIDQFMVYVDTLQFIDCNLAGEFISTAGWLLEIKSIESLPGEEEAVVELDNPRDDLVQQLLDYKKYRDAACLLEERGRRWQQNYARAADDCPRRSRDLADEPILDVELWDLVSAFGRIIREPQRALPSNIVYEETPIETHMVRIQERLKENGSTSFSELFKPGMHKTALVGIFLASLELVRNYHVRVEQYQLFGEIWLRCGDDWSFELPQHAMITSA